jgi:hypothetical protein
MTTEEMQAYERERERIVRDAISAADRVILAECRGNTEVLAFLTSEVAAAFASKVSLMLRSEVYKIKMLCEVPPEVLNKGH